jgi:cytochrome c553
MKTSSVSLRNRIAAIIVACATLVLCAMTLAAPPAEEGLPASDGVLDLHETGALPPPPAAATIPQSEPQASEPDFPSRQSDLQKQSQAEADAKSWGCVQCHQNVGDMHDKATVKLGCVDCHGGNPETTNQHKAHAR